MAFPAEELACVKVQKCIQGVEMSLQVLLSKVGQRESWGVEAEEVDGGPDPMGKPYQAVAFGFYFVGGEDTTRC